MRILQLHTENYKRLGIVEITPEGHVVTIGGKNGQGKSSVLGAIYTGLKGRAVAPPVPIRKGEEKCVINLDLGDIVVTRTFTQKEGTEYTDTLKVESADGLRYSKPQQVLDALLGDIGFDPFEFVKMKPKAQTERLLEMVPLSIDLDEFAAADASDYSKRTEANRDVARLRAQVESIPKEDVPADLPDRTALTDQLGNAANINAAIIAEKNRRFQADSDIDMTRNQADMARQSAERLRREADEQDQIATAKDAEADKMEAARAALPPLDEPVDTDQIREQLRDAETAHATADRQRRRTELESELAEAEATAQAYTDAMAARAKERNDALASAEMPVDGLSFAIGDDGKATLMYDGLPFDREQTSTAVQLRVSTAIGMAANPRLRVLRIMDGSLLDDESMALLAQMAEAEDFQLWVEVVGDGGVGIIMENGLVRGAAEPEPVTQDESKDPPKDDTPAQGKLV